MLPEYDLNVIPYASTIMFEVYQQGDKWTIKTRYNGNELAFSQCNNKTECTASDWMKHMNDRLVIDKTELQQQCDAPAVVADYANDVPNEWHFNETIKEEADKEKKSFN